MWKASNSCPNTTRFEDYCLARWQQLSLQEMCEEDSQLLQTVRGVRKGVCGCFCGRRGKGKRSTNSYERKVFSSTKPASPTGVTPKAKRLKESTDTAQEHERLPLSKRSLCFDKYSVVEDEISSLMNIPTETYLPPISKVSANSNITSKFCIFLD